MIDFLLHTLFIFVVLLAANTPKHALRDVMLQRCAGDDRAGNCWCRSAATCLFKRCSNCDMPVDSDGNALLDDFYAAGIDRYAGPCPFCDGPMRKL